MPHCAIERGRRRCGLCLGLMLLTLSLSAAAEEASTLTPDQLRSGTREEWFDADRGEWVFPDASSLSTGEEKLSDRNRFGFTPSNWNWDWLSDDWSQFFSKLWEFVGNVLLFFGRFLVVAAIIALVVYLIIAIIKGTGNPLNWRKRRESEPSVVTYDPAKVEELPFPIEASDIDLLSRAEAFRRAAEYGKSIIYLYGYLLVALDAKHVIRLQRGKTNRMYLRELCDAAAIAKSMRYMVDVYEAVLFGRYTIDKELCDRCWNLLPSIREAMDDIEKNRNKDAELAKAAASSNPPSLSSVPLVWLGVIVSVCVGCASDEPGLEEYAESSARLKKTSLGGLGLFRSLCDSKGFTTFDVTSFTNRSRKLDVLLWAPRDYYVPDEREMQWLNDWLSQGRPCTLIFVGRDYSPSAFYWSRALDNAAPADRTAYRLKEAFAQTSLENLRRKVDRTACDWFLWERDRESFKLATQVNGELANQVDGDVYFPYRDLLKPDKSEWTFRITPPLNQVGLFGDSSEVPEEIVSEYGSPQVEELLATDDDDSLIWRLRYRHWGNSEVILLANAACVANEGLTYRGNLEIAESIIDRFPPRARIGFLASDGRSFVRNQGESEQLLGFELLRVWPLSFISMHGLLIGFVALLALWPIFGRPQRLPPSSDTDFGKHIEALGELLYRARDRAYAEQKIAEYFRDVRGDPSSDWAQTTPSPAATPTTYNTVPIAEPAIPAIGGDKPTDGTMEDPHT